MTTISNATSSLAQMMAMLRQSYSATPTSSTTTSSDDTSTTIDTRQKTNHEPFVSGQMAINGDTFSTLLASQSVNASTQAEAEADFQEAFNSWYSSIDTDNSGTLSKDEFVAAKPDTVTAEEAASLYDQIDSESTDALTESQLAYGLVSASHLPPPPPQPEENKEPASIDEMFSAMDTDGDGAVTKEEFLAAKPDDVTDEMAEALYASMDTEGTGSITKEQLASSMQGSGSNVASSGGGGGGGGSSSTKEVVSETTVTNPDKSTTTTTTYSDGTTVTETTPASTSTADSSTEGTATETASEAFLQAILGRKSDSKSLEALLASLESSMGASLG